MSNSSQADLNNPQLVKPLPCRGCTADCRNIRHCKGRPWRQTDKK